LWIYITKLNKPWFKAKEIAGFLGYKWEAQAIAKNVSQFNKRVWNDLIDEDGGCSDRPPHDTPSNWQPYTVFISEAGLYQLMMKSKLPGMEDFQNWVTSDVLPSIRKVGSYSTIIPEGDDMIVSRDYLFSVIKTKDDQIAIKDEQIRTTIALLTKRDEQLDESIKLTRQLTSQITTMMKYVAKRPNNPDNQHVLKVYHVDETDDGHLYRGVRRQRKYMKCYKPGSGERLIFNEESPNPIGAFNRVKDFVGPYKCSGNLLRCSIDINQMKEFLNKY
jgi:prophage antirepressor-like protein